MCGAGAARLGKREFGAISTCIAASNCWPNGSGCARSTPPRSESRMRIAFYAPLKPPDHPVPSGDREIARLFLAALRRAGHEPFLASRMRSFDGAGDAEHQARIAALNQRTAERLLRRWRGQP